MYDVGGRDMVWRGNSTLRMRRMGESVKDGNSQHELTPAAQRAPAVGLAFHEAIDEAPLEVFRPRPFRQLDPGVANGIVDAVDIKRVAHDRMANPIAATGGGLVAEQHDLPLGQFHT